MKLVIASDHAGFYHKEALFGQIKEQGYDITDLGTRNPELPDDYPDYAARVAEAILNNQADRGIIICGSGVGVSIAVNKFKGVRAGVCHDTYSAHQCVEHDDANVLCIGERVVGIELAREIVFSFIKAVFSNEERHVRRLNKIIRMEEDNMK